MELKQYREEALKTCVLKDRNFNLRHAALGMVTEPAELLDAVKKNVVYGKPLDAVNIKEEIGDGLWYAAVMATALAWDLGVPATFEHDLPGDPDAEMLVTALCAISSVLAIGIEMTIVNHDDEFLVNELPNLFATFMGLSDQIAKKFGFTLEEACDANIAKLKKRYPQGFTSEAALNRNLEDERKALESAQ